MNEGFRYYVQLIFSAPDEPQIEDKGYTYEFLAPTRLKLGTETRYELPLDNSKGQLTWSWIKKDKKMISKYVRMSSSIPWFGGTSDFEDDIVTLFPNTATYMLVKPYVYYYRISDKKLVDMYDNETNLGKEEVDISSSYIVTYST